MWPKPTSGVIKKGKCEACGSSLHRRKRKATCRIISKFNTDGNDKADATATQGAGPNKARGAEWLSSDVHDEGEQVKQSVRYAVCFSRKDGGAMQKLEDRKQEQNIFTMMKLQ